MINEKNLIVPFQIPISHKSAKFMQDARELYNEARDKRRYIGWVK